MNEGSGELRVSKTLSWQNRIDGVFKLGENWAIPDNAKKPIDNRKKGNK